MLFQKCDECIIIIEHVYLKKKCHVQLPPLVPAIFMFIICLETIKLSTLHVKRLSCFCEVGKLIWGKSLSSQWLLKTLKTTTHFATSKTQSCGGEAAHVQDQTPPGCLVLFVFFFKKKNMLLCISLERVPDRPEQGPRTSDTKRRLLFHACVLAEPGHVCRVTGLLAVFAVVLRRARHS